jgi:hypothetical protein
MTDTPNDDLVADTTEKLKEALLSLKGQVVYVLTMTDIEIFGVIELALPNGFVLSYPARLHQGTEEHQNELYLLPLGVCTFARKMFISHEKILVHGEAQPSMIEFYNNWRNSLIEAEAKYLEKSQESAAAQKKEVSQDNFEDQAMNDLVKSGKIVHFQRPPNKTQQ